MTMSVEKRAAAMKRVLVRLSEMFWDKPRDTFGAADLAGTSPLLTTLAEMEDKRLIEHVMFVSNPKPYLLTMSGWYNAHRVAGRFQTKDFEARRARLCAALKGAVKGRHDDAVLNCSEIARLANLPEAWVWNVIEGQVLFMLNPRRRYALRFEDGTVYVRSTFGQVEVSLDK